MGGHGGVKTVGGQGTQTNVLSTQSTSEPDVVNGMRESMVPLSAAVGSIGIVHGGRRSVATHPREAGILMSDRCKGHEIS